MDTFLTAYLLQTYLGALRGCSIVGPVDSNVSFLKAWNVQFRTKIPANPYVLVVQYPACAGACRFDLGGGLLLAECSIRASQRGVHAERLE